MARHSKQRIQKDNYHDHIFNICRNRLYQTELDSQNVHYIIKALEITSNIISREEYNIILSYNEDDRENINISLFRTVTDLERLYESDNFSYLIKPLKKTFKLASKYSKDLRSRQKAKLYIDITNIVSDEKEAVRIFELTVERAFLNYYKIISQIVEDINNMPGWKEISDYYKRRYENLLNPQVVTETRPLTFLSYAFKDNIYALFLFDMFERHGGFLYVDSLFGTDYGNDGVKIKNALSPWIDSASQILFLHSIHSDKVKKGLSSWCSWELGEAYRSNYLTQKNFFKVVVAGIRREDAHPIVDDQFKELDYVQDGIIIPK